EKRARFRHIYRLQRPRFKTLPRRLSYLLQILARELLVSYSFPKFFSLTKQ
ncbi:unnamed protein product, partial [marine sediment metagenome]